MLPAAKSRPNMKEQFRHRSAITPQRPSEEINGGPRRAVTISSVDPFHIEGHLLQGEVKRAWELNRHWLEEDYMREIGRGTKEASRFAVENRFQAGADNHDQPDLLVWAKNDPEDPTQYSLRRKSWITFICCILTINVTFGSSAPSTAIRLISKDFHVSQEAALLITSIFLCGFVTGPLIWAPLSELLGRRPVFIGTILAYALCTIGQGLGKTIAVVLSTRFLAGVFASAPLTNCGGVIADIWGPEHRGNANALFAGSVFIGPVMGPVVGGFLTTSSINWRWIWWIMIIFALFCWILVLLFLPETYQPVLISKRARHLRKKNSIKYKNLEEAERTNSGGDILKRTLLRPFTLLFREPILALITIYLSIVYGLLYALFSVFPIIWQQVRHLNAGQGGLIFIGVGLGTTIGAMFSIYIQRHYPQLVREWHGTPPPEERLVGAMYAGPCLTIGIFWLGWTGAFASVPWYVPALATIPIGISFTLIFISYLTYIVDTYVLFAASALAANTIIRSAVGAACPLFVNQMFKALTIQGACSLIGGVSIVLVPIPFVFYKYGSQIRERSKYAPCIDIQIRPRVEEEKRQAKRNAEAAERASTDEHSTSSTAV